eukprot:SAG22_NODE_1734_length_3692_cov_2.728361_4_plen_101_part_00
MPFLPSVCHRPSRNATLIDEHNAQWLDRHRWNSLSFALHPMCEWGGGHFLDSRHAYALTNPFRHIRGEDSNGHANPLLPAFGARIHCRVSFRPLEFPALF